MSKGLREFDDAVGEGFGLVLKVDGILCCELLILLEEGADEIRKIGLVVKQRDGDHHFGLGNPILICLDFRKSEGR